MNVVTLEKPGRLRLSEADRPEAIFPDEALVRVHRVGVCGTDLHAYRGRQPFFRYPRILGHELGVEVIEVGPNERGLQAGSRCAVEPYLHCGQCIACRRGKPNCCVRLHVLGVHIDGGMREFLAVPVDKLHPSAALSFDQLALVETLGIGAHAVSRAQVEAGEFVLVIGAGPIGLSVIQFAQAAGARVIVLDVNENRLRFCRDHLRIRDALPARGDPLDALQEITGGDLPTAVFDATGNAESMTTAFRYVSHGGRLVFVGLVQGEVRFDDPDFHRRELTVLSSRNSTATDFTRIIDLLEAGQVDTASWITHRARCHQLVERFPAWLEPEAAVIKAVVDFSSSSFA